MDIPWQQISDNLKTEHSKRLRRETLTVFYSAFESSITYDCNFCIRSIGRFRGTAKGIRRKRVIANWNKPKIKNMEKLKKRKQRLWRKVKIDKYWND